MELGLLSSSKSYQPSQNTTPNPNPYRFKVYGVEKHNGLLLANIQYPNCTTFGGHKLMVLDMTREELQARSKLDPHFFEDGYVLARFPPTKEGKERAIAAMNAIKKGNDD